MSLPDQLADAAVSMPGQENAVAIPEGYVRVPILNMVVKKETALLLAVVAAVAIYYITKKKDD